MLHEDYEFYHTDEPETPYQIATIEEAIEDYDLNNETGRYEPTVLELYERIRYNYPRKTDKWIMDACKRYIAQSRKLHEMHKRELGLVYP